MSNNTDQDAAEEELEAALEEIKKKHPFFDLVTGQTNQYHELIKWCGFGAFVSALIFQAFDVIYNKQFNLIAYAGGMGVLLPAIAGAIRLNKPAESA